MVRRTLLLAALYLSQAGHNNCSGDILHDSGFDLWCGEELCSWKVEAGQARRSPTWHPDDLGVELIGDQVVISQRSDVRAVPCVLFDLVADIDLDATVTLEMDLFADGEVDFSERLPTASWERLSYLVAMPERYQGITFRLRKEGGGRAVLAQIRAREAEECEGAPLAQPVSPLGAGCWDTDDEDLPLRGEWCASGTCAPSRPLVVVCSECADAGDCGEGMVCGVESAVPPFLDPYRTCIAAASRGLGELCWADDECSTAVCCGGVCSDCCSDDERGCASCGSRVIGGAEQCAAGSAASGAACLVDDDCAGGTCTGGDELRVCADGRRCDDDQDCPPDQTQEHDEFGTCNRIGVSSGTCD
jgi:hypothetical protein